MDDLHGPVKRFMTDEIIVGLSGLALVALMFIPWFVWIASGISITSGGDTRHPGGNLSAWGFFERVAYVFLLAALLAIALAVLGRRLPRRPRTALSVVVAGVGLALAVLTLRYIAAPPLVDARRGSITIMDVDSAPALGAYLGALATLGIALGGALSLRSRRR